MKNDGNCNYIIMVGVIVCKLFYIGIVVYYINSNTFLYYSDLYETVCINSCCVWL